MGFLDREAKVAGVLGRGLGRSIVAIARGAVGGKIRRRITLVVLAVGGAAGYIWLKWDLRSLLLDLLELVFGIPAPGKPLSPATWVAPQNGIWTDLMTLSRVSMGVAGLAILALAGRATVASEEIDVRRGLHRAGYAGLMVLLTWSLIPFGLHLADQIATALSPSPELLLTSLPSTASGVVVLALTAVVQPLLVAMAVVAMAMLRAIILAGFILWPLAWPLRVIEHDLTERLGRSITALFAVAVATKLMQSMLVFGMIYLTGALDSVVIQVLIFIGGTVSVFVVLPLKMLQHAERVMMLPGALVPSERQVGQYIEESSKRVGQVHKQLDSGYQRARERYATSASHEAVQTRIEDWDEGTNEDSSWWDTDWIQHDLVSSDRHTSAEWQRSSTHASMSDGSDRTYGPESEDPDEPAGSQGNTTAQSQSRRDEL